MKKIKDNPNYYANILNITLIYTPPLPREISILPPQDIEILG